MSDSAPDNSSSPVFSRTLTENPTASGTIADVLTNPGFGTYFTDHMVVVDWTEDAGWHDARVVPYAPVPMDPATSVFHYGQAIFEGLKAYRQPDGSIATFRPEKNADRIRSSARRIAMPEVPEDLFLESLAQLTDVDREWVPAAGGEAALYLRPFLISTEVGLGVHPSSSYSYYVIASPAGAYFKGGVTPVSVWLSTEYVRAAPGGTGAAKFAGNYAASLAAQAYAEEKGCDQVVWLDAATHTTVEEMGGMNLAFIFGGTDGGPAELVTPELSGSLLPGVTRDSLLQLAADEGLKVTERRFTVEEWRRTAASGEMAEAFACGTAAVITPVGTVKDRDGEFQINGGEPGEITMRLRERLTGIQRGTVDDTHGWNHTLVQA
ncbi:MAG: branched-chain amino acid aminotransferase [Corynebacterium sp.]|uniref:branched-chain amino acid aminotransferase n=1 Tax=unclassified Corynebacterium TaxID=2624378 RepID=UPI002647D47E|nr:branched-chain amino acid aminotransferase [Corynebacterium sp.]MDN5581404.1 branched-chain amino acid aminotransferase [Corynebacterium sp.]MDN5719454.1 branched-chain amino acid aminotransferase [Corynebacterium sp.]MDN6386448.1 branched-chain amino acid aminotransferase [Corynebacterium sp.]MDN6510976.1 branched-chain amino acid aminotransferase [Corynebacterium sp.]